MIIRTTIQMVAHDRYSNWHIVRAGYKVNAAIRSLKGHENFVDLVLSGPTPLIISSVHLKHFEGLHASDEVVDCSWVPDKISLRWAEPNDFENGSIWDDL